jgi:hypothetical protein
LGRGEQGARGIAHLGVYISRVLAVHASRGTLRFTEAPSAKPVSGSALVPA